MAEGSWYPSSFTLSRFVHREIIVLVILCGAAIAGFIVTKASADAARELRVRDARTWHDRGMAHLEAGRLDEAAEALGRARALDRDERTYHLAFGRALAAAGNPAAARQALLTLRQTHPEDPGVNFGLAEVEASAGNVEQAVRFYQSALYGAWEPDRLDDRRRLRVRMIEYLIAQDMPSRAIAQLLLLEADLPAETGPRLEAARLFLAAGDPARALELYRRVLEEDPRSAEAQTGAGRAAFATGDFAAARRHLGRSESHEPDVEEMRELAQAALTADPLEVRLSNAERRRRLAAGINHLARAVAACLQRAPQTRPVLADHDAALRAAAEPSAARTFEDPEAFESGVALVARAAAALPAACGPPDVTTRAWRLIGRARARQLQ
ncbi:MAG TPA: tetratricopeptide repeat protein [Vicinamibacterales bacterium]